MKKYIINKDQTPIIFTSHSIQTLEMRGIKTVTIPTSTQDTRCATFAVTVCADGTKLPPVLIIKGEPNNRITAKEFPMFPTGWEYFYQENTWMDEGAMLEKVEKFSSHSLQQHQKILFHCSCWILTNATWHWLSVQSNSLTWKLSLSLKDVHHFVGLLMLELTGHQRQTFVRIGRIGYWILR